MKACVLENKNQIKYKEVENPVLRDNEVLVKIKACGICSSDFNRVFGNSAYFFPIILGHEFSGEIIDCFNDENKKLIGKRAVIFPLVPCNSCEFCEEKSYAQCKNYKYFGSRCNGAMTEYIAVPVWNIKLIPEELDFKIAALCEPAAVAVHTVNKIKNLENKSICISGNGTIGIICGILAKTKNANVTYIVRNEKKLNFLKELGFKNFINEADNKTFDICIECVGSNNSIKNCIEKTKSKGEIVFTGNPEGDINLPQKTYWKILRSEISIKGVWNSSYKNNSQDDWDLAIDFLTKNQPEVSKLITHKFKLEDGINAFNALKQDSHIAIKGVFVNE